MEWRCEMISSSAQISKIQKFHLWQLFNTAWQSSNTCMYVKHWQGLPSSIKRSQKRGCVVNSSRTKQNSCHSLPEKEKTTPSFLSNLIKKQLFCQIFEFKIKVQIYNFWNWHLFTCIGPRVTTEFLYPWPQLAEANHVLLHRAWPWVHSDVSIQQDDIHVNHAQQSTESDRCSKTE